MIALSRVQGAQERLSGVRGKQEAAISFRLNSGLLKARMLTCAIALAVLLIGALASQPLSAAQDSSDVAGPVEALASPQLFATMCALYASGLDVGGTSVDQDPQFADLRARLLQAHGPATEALRKFYGDHVLASPAATLSRYVSFALVAGPPPKFALSVARQDLPPAVLQLDGFSQILENFYTEAQIDSLWRTLQPEYEKDALLLREPLGRVVLTGAGYLRELIRPGTGTFIAYAEPLVGGQTQFHNAGNNYGIVLDPKLNSFDAMRHAFLHFLLDPLPIRYQQQIMVDEPLFQIGAGAPRMPLEFRDDYSAYFTECLVKAVELRLRRLPPDQLAKELNQADSDGYVLIRPMVTALAKFEMSEPAMRQYFPDLVRSIDVNAERKRLQTVTFAPASKEQGVEAAHSGEGSPNGSAASGFDADLADGDRQIAAQNPGGAAAAFERVLAKQPNQPRALYGLAIASLLQGNANRARELFERVVSDSSAPANGATHPDPVALAWSHVYLGRMHDLDGDRDQALADYRAALGVSGVPEDARSAAQRGIERTYELAAPNPSPG